MKQSTNRRRRALAIRPLVALAIIATGAAAITWIATGRHVFTKYESLELLLGRHARLVAVCPVLQPQEPCNLPETEPQTLGGFHELDARHVRPP